MKISRRIILIALVLNCLIFVIPKQETSAQAVPPSQVVDYLKQKINIYYIGTTSMATSAFTMNEISPQTIQNNTDGVLFGRGGNNRMSNSARLLLSIFKNRQTGGNGLLQDWLYNLIKIKDKIISIYFINDALTPVPLNFISTYQAFDTLRENGGLRIWPGTFGPQNSSEAGSINLGEYHFSSSLKVLQLTFLELVTSLQVSSYRTLHHNGGFSFMAPTLGNQRSYCFTSVMDRRYVTDQGISHAISSSFDTAYQRFLYKWYVRPSMAVQREIGAGTFSGTNRSFWLFESTGFPGLRASLTSFPQGAVGSTANQVYGWYNFSNIATREDGAENYKIRNEITQALIYNTYMHIGSLSKFINAVKLTIQQYSPAGSRTKFTLMLENMCRIAMGSNTPAQLASHPVSDKTYLLPIAMVHLLTHRNSEFNYEKFTTSVGAGFPVEIFNLYTNDIMQAVSAIPIPPGNDAIFYQIRNQLNTILNP